MNYIKHTVAAHEHLRSQPDARPQHIALYWALFFAWNAEFFDKDGLTLDHEQVMNAAHIGNKHTYRDALRDLDAWGLIAYRPSKTRGTVSSCSLKVLDGFVGPEVAAQTPASKATSGPTKKEFVRPEVALQTDSVGPEVAAQNEFVGPEVAQHSLLYQTVVKTSTTNVGGGTKKKEVEVFSGEGFSEAQVLDDTASFDEPVPAPGAAPKEKVARKRKGVGEPATASNTSSPGGARRQRGGRPQRPEVPFAESELASYEAFAAAFAGTDYELADLRYYHASVANWRKDGEPPLRRDWKATATKFMLNDARDNNLKPAPGTQRHQPGANHPDAGARPTGSGYRSKYDA